MKKSSLFLIYCLLFISGIFFANFIFKFIHFDEFYLFIILLSFIVLSIINWHNTKMRLIIFGLFFLFLGCWRFELSLPNIDKNHIAYYNNRKMNFIGQIISEPDIRATHRKLVISKIVLLHEDSPLVVSKGLDLKGKILISTPNSSVYNYGTWLNIKCELQSPGIIQDFDYGKYLATKNIYSVCYYANDIKILNYQPLSFWQKFNKLVLSFKYKTKKIIDASTPRPQNEILSAIILGLRKNIPPTILADLKATGLSHIIAISGLHISIMASLLLGLFIFIGCKRKYAFYLATLSLILFLMLIGFRASSLRAGIMGFVALWALNSGRLNKSINALLLAASILLLINPQLLLSDVGFQLSFLAVIGIIFLSNYINNFLTYIKIPEDFAIKASLTMTLSAQSMVLPLIVYYFGNLSLIAPLANVLVLPLIPFIMILGLMQSSVGFIFLPLAQLTGYLTSALINWIILVSHNLTNLPGANFEIIHFDLFWLFIIYILLGWVIWLITILRN